MNVRFFRLTVALLPLLMAGLLVAQDKPTKPPPAEEEKETPKKPIKKSEEDEKPTKPVKPVPKDDEEKPTKPVKPVPRDDGSSPPKPMNPMTPAGTSNKADKLDLASEPDKIKNNPEVRKLYAAATLVADRILRKGATDVRPVEPIPDFIGQKSNSGLIAYKPLNDDGKPGDAGYTANPGDILRCTSYEEYVLDAASNFVVDMPRLFPIGHPNHLSAIEYLGVADKVLTSVHKFHEDARKNSKRVGPGWDAVKGSFMAKYLDVLSDELKALIAASADKAAADKATDLALRLTELFPDSIHAAREIALWKLSLVNNDLTVLDKPYMDAAGELERLQIKFPNADAKVLEPLRDALRRRTQAHFDEAKKLMATEEGKPAAQWQLDMAMKIWPSLPGLKEYAAAALREFRMLVVGVRQLPDLMSPALAITDPDRWAVELLFESLVKAVPDRQVGYRYQPGLAVRLPRTILNGREFELPPPRTSENQGEKYQVFWVDRASAATKEDPKSRVDSSDVRGTLAMLQANNKLPVAENAGLLTEPVVRDPFKFPLRLDRGCLDPLSVMSFKVLPANLLASKPKKMLDEEFARNPVGSGPYCYDGRVKEKDGREYAVFKANPHYGKREGRVGLPLIQQIRFVVPQGDPAAELREGRIDLLLDVPTSEMMRLREPRYELSKVVSDHSLASRRIWMLAVNHRTLGGDAGRSFRRAVAFAIDRDEVLSDFRSGTTHHQALYGPFPANTWASPPNVQKYPKEHAASEAAKANKPEKLRLLFVDNPLSRKACEKIVQQVGGVGITITLVPKDAAGFHQAVMMEHDFELAYMPYDYANDTYSLRGLFDGEAVGSGERNFMGYRPDSQVSQFLGDIGSTRDFPRVREAMHRLYPVFEDKMPFIPLWQLDFHYVVSLKLDTVPNKDELSPHTIFDMVELWRINR